MKLKSYADMNCSLAQTLEVIGERWTLLILRDAFFGVKRFDDFCSSLGIARNMLSKRLNRLVEAGILSREAAPQGRHEYRLTAKGLDLQPILLSMTHWGDRYYPHPAGDRLVFVDRQRGEPVQPMGVRGADGRVLGARDIRAVPGPGLAQGLDD